MKDKRKCRVCGATLSAIVTDLPFKVSATSIVILKQLPVLQCENCQEFLIEDLIMKQVEDILSKANDKAELEVVYFAA
ncbi:MAG: YgiT-type zinc finger protein [Calditrichaeota bacterium]|nr:YgiT-type zinc finger protein [Calditrichota bacterium]